MNEDWLQRGRAWLESVQHDDGGWGERCNTYDDPVFKGQGPSTASQTAWAVMGLCAFDDPENPALKRGIEYLVRTQNADGSWTEARNHRHRFPESVLFEIRHVPQRLAAARARHLPANFPPRRPPRRGGAGGGAGHLLGGRRARAAAQRCDTCRISIKHFAENRSPVDFRPPSTNHQHFASARGCSMPRFRAMLSGSSNAHKPMTAHVTSDAVVGPWPLKTGVVVGVAAFRPSLRGRARTLSNPTFAALRASLRACSN